jgi:hypothetical protein
MSNRPTLDDQLADQHRRGRQPPSPLHTTRTLINALLWVWLLISVIGLVAAVLGLALLMRAVF